MSIKVFLLPVCIKKLSLNIQRQWPFTCKQVDAILLLIDDDLLSDRNAFSDKLNHVDSTRKIT